jgi:hypothetical protein
MHRFCTDKSDSNVGESRQNHNKLRNEERITLNFTSKMIIRILILRRRRKGTEVFVK